MTKKTRMFTGLVAAAMALVLLLSALYIAVEADHSCTGEDCAVCCPGLCFGRLCPRRSVPGFLP